MAGEGQLLFHDFLGTNPNEQKPTEGSLSHISSSTAPSNGRGFEEKTSRILSARASSVTHEWPEVPCSAPPLLSGAFALTGPSISEPSSGGFLATNLFSAPCIAYWKSVNISQYCCIL